MKLISLSDVAPTRSHPIYGESDTRDKRGRLSKHHNIGNRKSRSEILAR